MDIHDLTIGIEEEYQIIDAETRELTSYVSEFLDQGALIFRDQVKPEFLQSQIEVGSHVCRNIREARLKVRRLRNMVSDVAEANHCRIVAAGTHPFSRWEKQQITPKARYQGLAGDLKMVVRQLLIFGMHIHIGIPDRQLQIDIMNQVQYFLPHILALSTSSPFWQGRESGLKSYRSVIFENLPRTGFPDYFQSPEEYDHFVQTLVDTHCVEDASKIWWNIRPHHKFPTLEFRVCDCTTKVDEVIAIAALLQALVATLIRLREKNQTWRIYRHGLIEENRWRAVKNGMDGMLIDLGSRQEVPLRFLLEELILLVTPAAEELGTLDDINYLHTMMKEGTSADRQLRTFRREGDLKKVVDQLAEETIMGC